VTLAGGAVPGGEHAPVDPDGPAAAGEREAGAGEREGLDAIRRKLRLDGGFDCGPYKDGCVDRRIATRMRARGCDRVDDYTRLLESDPTELERLVDTLTINVTKFFRNAEAWEAIASVVVPRLFEQREGPIRVRSAGCSTGEEPYSLSILLHEWAEREGREADLERVSIVGTDIDRRCLEAAARGEYPEMSFDETAPEVRRKWFSDGPPAQIQDRARRLVSFQQADIVTAHIPPGQGLIVCRNVLIYLERGVQEAIIRRFHEALLPGGILVLGRVETLLGSSRSLFHPLRTRERVYLKP